MSGGQPPRRWGWHALRPDRADRLVELAHPARGELVLDLGAGTGALTEPLRRTGAQVLAIELHPGRAAALRRRYADHPRRGPGGVAVVQTDLDDFAWPHRAYLVVANPPWGLGLSLVRRLTAPRSRLVRGVLVLPAAMVAQVCRGRSLGAGYTATAVGTLPRAAFDPPPPGAAGVLTLARR